MAAKLILLLLLAIQQCAAITYEDMMGFFKHTGNPGTQHGKEPGSPDYFESNSGMPHLPTISGFMGTHGTLRFVTVHEQVAIVVGDGKHGVWRVQDNGHIREYRKKGKKGIPKGVDPNDLTSQSTEKQTEYANAIESDYAAYVPDVGFEHYKYPHDKVSSGDGSFDDVKDAQNYLDLTIYHPKYKGKYDDHVAIDLPHYYCTMSQGNFPYVRNVWDYMVKQPRANIMGPLARRAGYDIKENNHHVVRFKIFEDTNIWANIGRGTESERMPVKNQEEVKAGKTQKLHYKQLDLSKYDMEAYLIERPFFNSRYIFVTFILDSKENRNDFSYIRPNGLYYEQLKAKGKTILNTVPKHSPPVYIREMAEQQKAYGIPVYGHHSPDRHLHGMTGGACPGRGGDWGTYPWGNPGSGFNTNLEEIGPLCDGLLFDVKMYANLDQPTWDDEGLFLGNAPMEDSSHTRDYTMDANNYGGYTDPYLIASNMENPYSLKLKDETLESAPDKEEKVVVKLDFGKPGKYLDFVKTKDVGDGMVRDEDGYIKRGDKEDVKCSGNLMTSNLVFCLVLAVMAVWC